MINALKPAFLVLAAALVAAAAFTDQSAGPRREQESSSVSLKAIDSFLADSRKYLGL